jgi:two-component system response regulator WspF
MLKVAVVNDSMLAAESLRRVVDSVPDYQLAWVAYNGREAVEKCRNLCPDVILMDLIMPVMDGIAATRAISTEFECAILVVTASVDGHAGKVFEAMGAGALDAVNTPVLGASGESEGRDALVSKINTIATLIHGKPLRRHKVSGREGPLGDKVNGPAGDREGPLEDKVNGPRGDTANPAIAVHSTTGDVPPLIAIGASTGGPSALCQVLQALPPNPGVAIAIIQHVDEQFAASFTRWLDEQVPVKVRMAEPGEPLLINTALVCGREDHLVVGADGLLDYNPEPRQLAYRPSVDVFFHSLAENYQYQSVGVLLTGMGRDGAAGLKALRERNWYTIAQDQASCAVYGMPKAAKELDAAAEILPLGDIGPRLAEWVEHTSNRGGGKRKSV